MRRKLCASNWSAPSDHRIAGDREARPQEVLHLSEQHNGRRGIAFIHHYSVKTSWLTLDQSSYPCETPEEVLRSPK
jgi:hypothetical protein